MKEVNPKETTRAYAVEFGLGYQIPFLKKVNRSEGKSNIFHHRKNWWKE